MATPNYAYEKRQRELAKKRKKEEKLQRKSQPRPDGPAGEDAENPGEGSSTPQGDTEKPQG